MDIAKQHGGRAKAGGLAREKIGGPDPRTAYFPLLLLGVVCNGASHERIVELPSEKVL